MKDKRNSRTKRKWKLWGKRLFDLANKDVQAANEILNKKLGITE